MSKQAWLGIDVAKATFHAALAGDDALPRDWNKLPHADFAHSADGMKDLAQWVKKQGIAVDGVCIEATGRLSQRWMELAQNRFGEVSMINPAYGVAYGKSLGIRSKNDRIDACVLATYGRQHNPATVRPVSAEHRELRELSRTLQVLKSQYQANRQRLADGPASQSAQKSLERVLKTLAAEITQLRAEMKVLVGKNDALAEDVRRIKTIKGIGMHTAILLVAEFGDLRAYNRDELVALAGLYPREHSSGASVHKKSRLAKNSKTQVRSVLYMCAMSAIRSNPHLRAFSKRLTKKHKEPMQILAAVMRKLLLIAHALIVTGKDYDPDYGITVQSLTA